MQTPSHASLCPGTPVTCDRDTGEVRVPLQLFALDRPVGTIELVLPRLEAEQLHAGMTFQMARADSPAMLRRAAV
ncbi:hypothetical protein ACFWZY_01455 [Streptomyces sp. NPDC058992]|uniref:hypothetical protein n=1 Tax=Streptomyces sp. NPDC058992 TaxID=3346688 RepID=UPI0036B24915